MLSPLINHSHIHGVNNWPENYAILWADEWFEEQINAWTLVLRWSYEDHTDYTLFSTKFHFT